MLSRYIRVIHSDNGTLTDKSLVSQDRTNTFSLPIVSGEDYIYIGQYYPTNNLYFSIDTANTNSATISIDIWNNEWTSAVDILDATSDSGKSMAQSGVVQWDIDRDNMGWTRLHDPTDEGADLGFNTLDIYDLYWIRIGFSADLSSGSDINQVGYKFASDNDIKALAPDINDYLASWETGKTNWEEQLLEGSKQLINWLKINGKIAHAGQLLRFDEVNIACAYRTLAIIYEGLGGENFRLMRDDMMANFYREIRNMPFVIDRDNSSSVDVSGEVARVSFGKLVR